MSRISPGAVTISQREEMLRETGDAHDHMFAGGEVSGNHKAIDRLGLAPPYYLGQSLSRRWVLVRETAANSAEQTANSEVLVA